MNYFSDIFTSLTNFKSAADKLILDYRKGITTAQTTYSDKVFFEKRMKLTTDFMVRLADRRDRQIAEVNRTFDKAQESLKSWIVAPTDTALVSTLSLIAAHDLKLSSSEIEALRMASNNSYFANRAITELAQKSGVIETHRPPKLDTYVNTLREAISQADFFVKSYYGDRNSIEYGRMLKTQDAPSDAVVSGAASCKVLDRDSALIRAAVLWGDSGIPGERRTELSFDDKQLIRRLYDGCNTEDARKARTARLVHETPELEEILILDDDLREYVESDD